MRGLLFAGLALLPLAGAGAQVLDNPVGAAVGAGARVPDPAGAVTGVGGAGRAAAQAATDAGTDAGRVARVDAGASVRVERGTRCYYEDNYYDPIYRDGYYYCERTGPSAGVAAKVKAPR